MTLMPRDAVVSDLDAGRLALSEKMNTLQFQQALKTADHDPTNPT